MSVNLHIDSNTLISIRARVPVVPTGPPIVSSVQVKVVLVWCGVDFDRPRTGSVFRVPLEVHRLAGTQAGYVAANRT